MSALTTYAISVGGSRFDNTPKTEVVTWAQFESRFAKFKRARCTLDTCAKGEHAESGRDGKPTCKHKDVGFWIPATFTGGRKQAAVNNVTFLVVDADHLPDQAALDATLAQLEPYRYVAHATHSDRPGNRCARIFIPLSKPVALADWKRFWVAAMTTLGMPADPSCCNADRLYYWPSRPSDAEYWSVTHEGEPLDVVEIAKNAPREEPRVADSLGLDDGGIVGEGKRHAMLVSTAGALRGRGAGEAEIYAALLGANKRCNPPKSDAELKEIAKWASEQSVGEKWRTPPPAEVVETETAPSDPWKAELAKALEDVRAKLTATANGTCEPLFDLDAVDVLAKKFDGARWLVTGLVTRGGITTIGGLPKAAKKTWLGTEIAIAIATGTPVCGEFFAEAGVVAYFYAEDMEDQIQNRIRSLLAGAGRTLQRGRLRPCPRGKFLDITRDEDLAWILASARRLGKIDLLVLDPLRDIHSAAEDKSDEMSPVMKRLRALAELLGCTVAVVHHSGKPTQDNAKRGGGQRLRGSGAVHGSTDSGIYILECDGDGRNKFRNTVESEIKGARSAGTFELSLDIEDDDQGAAVARWAFSREITTRARGGLNQNADRIKDEDDSVIGFIRQLGKQGVSLTKTALRMHPDRPLDAEGKTDQRTQDDGSDRPSD
jgi:hypothetical protein